MPELTTLLHAYHDAGRALDRGLHRVGGATAAEWQAEDDARIALRSARRAYVSSIRDIIDDSAAYQHRTVGGPRLQRYE